MADLHTSVRMGFTEIMKHLTTMNMPPHIPSVVALTSIPPPTSQSVPTSQPIPTSSNPGVIDPPRTSATSKSKQAKQTSTQPGWR